MVAFIKQGRELISNRIFWFKKTRKRNKIIIAIILILLFAGAWKIFGQKQATPQYQTAVVQRGTLISSLSESGNVSAGSQISITSPTDGIIEELYVKNGDIVASGQSLFKVKATATPQAQAAAYATYETALNAEQNAEQSKLALTATLEKDRQAAIDAQDTVDQMTNNVGAGANNPATKQAYTQNEKDSINSILTSSRESFTADEKKYTIANTAIAAAQASLQSASLSYQATQDSVVTAPTDGTVANLTADVGGNVTAGSNNNTSSSTTTSSGSSSSSNQAVMILGNFQTLFVKVQASEVDIPSLKPGQKATISLDAYPSKTFVGNVTNIDTIGAASSGVVTYNIYISFTYAPPGVEPGMTASVSIQTARVDNVLSVPSAAVQTQSGQSYVRILQNGKPTDIPVTTGIASDTDTEITSGLSDGQTVVTGTLTSGTATGTTGSSPFSGLGGNRGGFGGGGGGFGGGGRAGGGGAARGGQ